MNSAAVRASDKVSPSGRTSTDFKAELGKLEAEYAEVEEIPEDADARLGEIETALAAFDERPVVYDATEIARAGAFVSIDSAGALRIERAYVLPEDEAPVVPSETDDPEDVQAVPGSVDAADTDEEEDEGVRPLSDRLMTELTAHRTLALREAIAGDPDTAFLAMLHALYLRLFYRLGPDTCLEVEARACCSAHRFRGSATLRTPQPSTRGTAPGR